MRREEVLNVFLALLLHAQGAVTAPEEVLVDAVTGKREMPDVLVSFQGLRTAIEGKVDDQPAAAEEALQSAMERVIRGVAQIGVAVVYPRSLRSCDFSDLKVRLANASFQIAIVTESMEADRAEWSSGDLGFLAELLRRTFGHLVGEDVVVSAATRLDGAVSAFAEASFLTSATLERVSAVLGIGSEGGETESDDEED
jgi:hypothetical protein